MGFFRSMMTSVVNSVEKAGNSVINSAQKSVNNFERRSTAIVGAIDNMGRNVKDVGRNGLQRGHIDEFYNDKKTIEKNLPKNTPIPKPLRTVGKAIDTAHQVTKVVDKVNESK